MQFLLVPILSIVFIIILFYIFRRFSDYLGSIFPQSFLFVLIIILGYRLGFSYVEQYYGYVPYIILALVALFLLSEYAQLKDDGGDEE